MERTIIGIDPGKGGGIAIIKKGRAYAVSMPATLPQLNEYLKDIRNNNDEIIAFVEKVQIFDSDDKEDGKKYGIKKMLDQFAELKSCLVFHNIPFVEVAPITWQSELCLTSKGDTKAVRKNKYKLFAGRTFPDAKVNLNTSDALCISYFGIQRLKLNPGWVNERIVKKKTDLFK